MGIIKNKMKFIAIGVLASIVSGRSLIQLDTRFAGGLEGSEDLSNDILTMEKKEGYNLAIKDGSMGSLVQAASDKMFNAYDLPNCTGHDSDKALLRTLANKEWANCKYGDPDA